MATREQYYSMIHLGAKRLGYTDDADYRTWLESLTGKRSCKDCTGAELAALASTLRACNALEMPRLKGIQGGKGDNRPSDAQWRLANRLCRELDMSGCDDPRFAAFAKRIAKVDSPRFMTRQSIRAVIAALGKWIENTKKPENQK